MISAKRLEELRKEYGDLNPTWSITIWGDAMEEILSTLEASLKVVEAAKEALKHEYIKVDNFNKLDSLKEALAPFAEEKEI